MSKKGKKKYEPNVDILLEEYKTLRDEIINEQRGRLQIISFTIGAYGVILTVLLNTIANSDVDINNLQLIILSGLTILWAFLISSLLMIISTQRSIMRKGDYIRRFIEVNIPELRWQTTWYKSKEKGVKNRLQWARGAGVIYIFMTLLPLMFLVYAIFIFKPVSWWLFLPLPLMIVALLLSFDYLTYGLIKDWEWKWTSDE